MRSLFLGVYIVIVGGFYGAFYVLDVLSNDLYETEFRDGYSRYVKKISPLITSELRQNPDQKQVLNHWRDILGKELIALEFVVLAPEEKITFLDSVAVTQVTLTDLSDEIHLLFLVSDDNDERRALKFHFKDAYPESFEFWFDISFVTVYLMMAAVIGVLTFMLYRYLNRINLLATSVTAGDLSARTKTSRIPVFNDLFNNINQMASELESKHRESEIFLGAIHHELRSPITKLRLALDMALGNKEPKFQSELLSDMDQDLEELNRLMEDILMLSRLKLQEEQVDLLNIDIHPVISRVVSNIADARISIEPGQGCAIRSNGALLERVLHNVISNAVKFADNHIQISVTRHKNGVGIEISDDGPGIPVSERKLIFKPFYRVDKGRARVTGGVGLGLAIASIIVEKLTGEIEIEQSEFGGACFKIYLLCGAPLKTH